MDIQDVMGCLSFARPLWIPACAGMTGECAGMTVGVGLPQMGCDGRAQLIGLAGITWCCAICRLMFCRLRGYRGDQRRLRPRKALAVRPDQELRPSRFWEILGTGVVSCSYGTP